MFDYTDATKALLNSADVKGDGNDGWIEVELCADTGACGTVMPRKICQGIAIQLSLQPPCLPAPGETPRRVNQMDVSITSEVQNFMVCRQCCAELQHTKKIVVGSKVVCAAGK